MCNLSSHSANHIIWARSPVPLFPTRENYIEYIEFRNHGCRHIYFQICINWFVLVISLDILRHPRKTLLYNKWLIDSHFKSYYGHISAIKCCTSQYRRSNHVNPWVNMHPLLQYIYLPRHLIDWYNVFLSMYVPDGHRKVVVKGHSQCYSVLYKLALTHIASLHLKHDAH